MVRATLDDWKAGRVPSLSGALRQQLNLGPLENLPGLNSLQSPLLPIPSEGPSSSASMSRFLQGGSVASEQHQAMTPGTELGLPLYEDPPDELMEAEEAPLGTMPVWPHKSFSRPAMQPQKARVCSHPGRGPMPHFVSSHPRSRPFGVAQSSLAIREAAQLYARDPTARQLSSRRHAYPKLEQAAPKPDNLPAGFELPQRLPPPDKAKGLLAEAIRAERSIEQRKAAQQANSMASASMDRPVAGPSSQHVKDHPLVNPRANSNAAAATASRSALPPPATPPPTPVRDVSPLAAAPQAGAAEAAAKQKAVNQPQQVSPPAQAQQVNHPLPRPVAAAEGSEETHGLAALAGPSAAVQSDQPAAESAADADAGEDASAAEQDSKAVKQRPGRKQRRKIKELAEQARLDGIASQAKAQADAELKAQAEASAKAAEEASKAAAAAAAKAEADAAKAEIDAAQAAADEAWEKEEAIRLQAAEAASLKAGEDLLAEEEAAAAGMSLLSRCVACITIQCRE